MKKLMALIFLIILVVCLVGCNNEASSIGIIGGADGPAAMAVTSTIIWQSVFWLVAVIIVTILIVVIIYLIKKKK